MDRWPCTVERLTFFSDDESRSIHRVPWFAERGESVQKVCGKINSLLSPAWLRTVQESRGSPFCTREPVERLAFQSARSFVPKGNTFG
jgi:hypothetical protein